VGALSVSSLQVLHTRSTVVCFLCIVICYLWLVVLMLNLDHTTDGIRELDTSTKRETESETQAQILHTLNLPCWVS
jgi:hypothetical protein